MGDIIYSEYYMPLLNKFTHALYIYKYLCYTQYIVYMIKYDINLHTCKTLHCLRDMLQLNHITGVL